MEVKNSKSRLLSDVYSATSQRELSDAHEQWRDEYLGQLRFDAIVSQTIVLPDSHLFDGRYFLESDPRTLVRRLGRGIDRRTLPIEIRSREKSLEASLETFLYRRDDDKLNGFPFNTIADVKVRAMVAAHLATTDAQDLREHVRASDGNVARALVSFLRGILGRADYAIEGDLEILESGWSRWIEAERKGIVTVVPWNQAFNLREALVADPIDVGDLQTDVGRALHADIVSLVQSGDTYRSDVTPMFLEHKSRALKPDQLLDVLTLEQWYTQGRHRALALQHEASFAHSEKPEVTPIGPLRRLAQEIDEDGVSRSAGDGSIVLPDEVLVGLVRIPDERFGAFLYEITSELHKWWRDCDSAALAQIVERLAGETEAARGIKHQDPTPLIQIVGKAVAGAATSIAGGHSVKAGVAAVLVSEGITRVGSTLSRQKATRRITEQFKNRV